VLAHLPRQRSQTAGRNVSSGTTLSNSPWDLHLKADTNALAAEGQGAAISAGAQQVQPHLRTRSEWTAFADPIVARNYLADCLSASANRFKTPSSTSAGLGRQRNEPGHSGARPNGIDVGCDDDVAKGGDGPARHGFLEETLHRRVSGEGRYPAMKFYHPTSSNGPKVATAVFGSSGTSFTEIARLP
jgi:hypothetical protein